MIMFGLTGFPGFQPGGFPGRRGKNLFYSFCQIFRYLRRKIQIMETAVLVMAGGRGERFWPASTAARPKQLHNFGMKSPLIVQTAGRVKSLVEDSRVLVITSRDLVPAVGELLPELKENQIIGEPEGRNSAPCIGVAAVWMEHFFGPDCVMVVLSSDHYIAREDIFSGILRTGVAQAADGHLVTIGLTPTRPEVGYGYLELGEAVDESAGVYWVKRFLEKPEPARAERFFASGRHLWNGGMFLWKCSRILEEIRAHVPELSKLLEQYRQAMGTVDEKRVLEEIYPEFPGISIDYAVMEKAEDVVTVQADIGWDDLGNWSVLERLHESDEQDNIVVGSFAGVDSRDCIISADSGLVAAYGVKDLIIVKQGDVVLVMPKKKAPELKNLVSELKENPKWEKYL
jgi:mannose-1-phosphate guanylyltransferase